MRYCFTKRDVLFSRIRLAGGSQLTLTEERGRSMRREERAIVTAATAAQCG